MSASRIVRSTFSIRTLTETRSSTSSTTRPCARIQAELDARVLKNMDETGDAWNLERDFPPPGYLTHEEGKEYLQNVVLPAAIEVP